MASSPVGALALFLLGPLLVAACSPMAVVNSFVPEDGYALAKGRPYGGLERQKLDVYVPRGLSGAAPVVIFLYGGSWRQGDRAAYRFVGEALTSQGFIAVVPDYRLYPDVRFPAFVEDAARAVAWVRANIADFGGDPDGLFLMGHSAGAHMAALLTLDESYLKRAGVPRSAIRGTIGLAGPYAFKPVEYATLEPILDGTIEPIFDGLSDKNKARPITFVDGDEPPMLLLYGAEDTTVDPANSVVLARRIRAAGGEVRVIGYPDMGHVWIALSLAKPFRGGSDGSDGSPVLRDASAFIRAHAKPR